MQHMSSFLAAASDGKVPYLDGAVDASAEEMLAVRVPVNRGADALIVGCDLLFGALWVAKVPALNGAIVSSEGEFYSVSRRPLDVADAAIHAMILISAGADGGISAHVAQVPQADRGVMAGRKEQMALVGVEGKLVYLTGVLVQASKLYAGTVEVVEDDLAVGSRRGNMGAKLAVGPLDVVDAQALALAGM